MIVWSSDCCHESPLNFDVSEVREAVLRVWPWRAWGDRTGKAIGGGRHRQGLEQPGRTGPGEWGTQRRMGCQTRGRRSLDEEGAVLGTVIHKRNSAHHSRGSRVTSLELCSQ